MPRLMNPNICDPQGNSALHWAVKRNLLEVAIWLCESRNAMITPLNNQGLTPKNLAVLLGHHKMAQYLLKMEIAKGYSSKNMAFNWPLHYSL